MKKYLLLALLVVLIGGGYYVYSTQVKKNISLSDYKNMEYVVGGQKIKLINGVSEVPSAPGSASKTVTRYFGNEVVKDLDGDGIDDVAFLLTQNSGGSGTFFYVVGAIKRENGYVPTDAVLLGDRIAPQSTNSGPYRTIIVNYADRNPGEPMTVSPSVGKSLRLLVDPKTLQFGIVANDFEGEADPSRMSLQMKQWFFQKAQYNDGTDIVLDTKKFSVTFKKDGTFTATTDCNQVGGSYTVNGSEIVTKNVYSTKMFCEGSKESQFIKLLNQINIFHFTSKGELIFDLKYDSGVAIFK